MGNPEMGSYRNSVRSLMLHSCQALGPRGPPPPMLASMAPGTISSVTMARNRTRPRGLRQDHRISVMDSSGSCVPGVQHYGGLGPFFDQPRNTVKLGAEVGGNPGPGIKDQRKLLGQIRAGQRDFPGVRYKPAGDHSHVLPGWSRQFQTCRWGCQTPACHPAAASPFSHFLYCMMAGSTWTWPPAARTSSRVKGEPFRTCRRSSSSFWG